MKSKLPLGVCVALAAALTLFGLLYGVFNGYAGERREVTALLEAPNGLMDVLDYRAADGLNLCVVAGRHLPMDDANLAALRSAAVALRDEEDDPALKYAKDEALEAAVTAVAQRLQQTESFLTSDRDQKYLDMLTADLKNLAGSAAAEVYNEAAEAFNERLDAPVLGWLARLMGIAPCALYGRGV